MKNILFPRERNTQLRSNTVSGGILLVSADITNRGYCDFGDVQPSETSFKYLPYLASELQQISKNFESIYLILLTLNLI